jgi:epsin
MRDRMLGNIAESGLRGEGSDGGGRGSYDAPSSPPARRQPQPSRNRDEDDDLRRAIEESKRMSRDEESRRGALSKEEDELQRAIRLSEEEEAKRKRELEESNAKALFDDDLQL